jgi:hypothetical protein
MLVDFLGYNMIPLDPGTTLDAVIPTLYATLMAFCEVGHQGKCLRRFCIVLGRVRGMVYLEIMAPKKNNMQKSRRFLHVKKCCLHVKNMMGPPKKCIQEMNEINALNINENHPQKMV